MADGLETLAGWAKFMASSGLHLLATDSCVFVAINRLHSVRTYRFTSVWEKKVEDQKCNVQKTILRKKTVIL